MSARRMQEHEAHRLALALRDPVPAMLREVGVTKDAAAANGNWARTYARFDPGTAPYCTMLYETTCESGQALCLVELSGERPTIEHELEQRIEVGGLGWARISKFPHDTRLATLERVRAMAFDAAGECTVLRYRPRKRCTLLAGALESDADQVAEDQVAKVFADDRGELMHRDAVSLSQAAARGELAFEVARPRRWDPGTRSLWQSRLAGNPLVSRLGMAEGEALATRLGVACASLTRSSLSPSRRIDGRAQFERTARYADELVRRIPRVKDQTNALLARLRDAHADHDARPLMPVRGARRHRATDSGGARHAPA